VRLVGEFRMAALSIRGIFSDLSRGGKSLTSRADIVAMGTLCMQLGLTPDDVEETVRLGAIANFRGLTSWDLFNLWNIKWRALNE
jgi:hypothetical protein